MASGVKVADEIKDIFQTMKVNRSSDKAKERIRLVQLGLNDPQNTLIEVKKIVMEKDLDELGNLYTYAQSLMNDKECTYILYDCHYETDITKKEDLIFIMWSCDCAPIKKKMAYASSKNSLKKVLDVKFEMELHSKDETCARAFIKNFGKEIVKKLEGIDVCEN
ncbi:hypothetical protein WMY93_018197 [Mugilogobius chulae]|uniref:ADF-H domain-containing protein n=1 Tax=Mugilogobius chulae TaxID=88201 RepID=A0AAW0NJB5_9GOBI